MTVKENNYSLGSATSDPIELHILRVLKRAQGRNKKLARYLARPETKSNMRHVDDWKSNDFFNYFCALFQENYKQKYKLNGSLARAYQRIESFLAKNKISNKEYKDFIDTAFSRFFKISSLPALGSIVNADLAELVLGRKNLKNATPKDLLDLENRIEKENLEVERYLDTNNVPSMEGDFDAVLREAGIAPLDFEVQIEGSRGHLPKT